MIALLQYLIWAAIFIVALAFFRVTFVLIRRKGNRL